MLEAKRGVVSDELREVSRAEGIDEKVLLRRVAKGRVVIPKNNAGREFKPIGIGEGLRVKVNANIGTSPEHVSVEEELEKARVAVKYGADTLMDLSTGGDLKKIRREILKIPVPLGTVPIYEAGVLAAKRGSIADMSEDEL